MGRPKSDNPRDWQLNLSLTRGEHEHLRWHAEARGLRLAEYARAVLLYQMPAITQQRRVAPSVDRLVFLQIKRLGNNLNQIARRLNATKEPVPPSLEPLLRDIRALLDKGLRG